MANCRPSIPDFTSPECSFEAGRIVAIAFIHKGIHSTIFANPSNAALWVDGSYSADLHVFQEVRGTYSGGQPTEINGLGTQSTRVINGEHSINVRIEGVKNNETFWNELAKSHEYRVAFVVGGNYDLLFINDKDCSIYANVPIEEGLDSEVLWNVDIKWRDFDNPKSSDVPTGIFN